jgi:hypothetical protein
MVWLAGFCARLSHPSTSRIEIGPDAINAQSLLRIPTKPGKSVDDVAPPLREKRERRLRAESVPSGGLDLSLRQVYGVRASASTGSARAKALLSRPKVPGDSI